MEYLFVEKNNIKQSLLNIENKERSNLFSWNGQFSPQFVETMLSHYCSENDTVLDPFSGSGTTLYEAARRGQPAIGIEINPAAYFISKIYELCNYDQYNKNCLINDVTLILKNIDSSIQLLPLIEKFQYLETILKLLFILSYDKTDVKLAWARLKEQISNLPFSERTLKVLHKDARSSGLESDSVDLVFTSPPYINVYNYHQQYRNAIELLGYNVLNIAKSEFGANRKHRGNRFLTIIQYCIDMAITIQELIRVCKKNASLIFIVGRSSKVLGIPFSNSKLLFNIANSIFHLTMTLKQERYFKNKFGQVIYEDILHFNNSKRIILKEDIISQAQILASKALEEQRVLCCTNLLESAIECVSEVSMSNIMEG